MPKTVLIVDDSEIIRSQLRLTIERAGFAVKEATDADAGVTAARGNAVDLIISDVNMPGKDGLTMIGEIRKLPSYAKTPVFVLTTESTPEMVQRGKQVGATAWIVKPFNPDVLVTSLRKLLGAS